MGERTHWCIMPISGQWVIAAMVVPTGLCQKMLNIWRGANKIYIRRCIIGDIISMSTRLKNGRFTKRKKRDVVSENVKSVGIEWCDGRRIINLKLLANRLMECSNNLCKKPLTLCNISSESNVGVASILFITCECGHMNRVPTDTTHPTFVFFPREPLPADDLFWAHPKVTVTPHIASATRPETSAQVIAENIHRDDSRAPFLYLVDRKSGY